MAVERRTVSIFHQFFVAVVEQLVGFSTVDSGDIPEEVGAWWQSQDCLEPKDLPDNFFSDEYFRWIS